MAFSLEKREIYIANIRIPMWQACRDSNPGPPAPEAYILAEACFSNWWRAETWISWRNILYDNQVCSVKHCYYPVGALPRRVLEKRQW